LAGKTLQIFEFKGLIRKIFRNKELASDQFELSDSGERAANGKRVRK
jgi:hypothetical protein